MMRMVHRYGVDRVSGTTDAMFLAAELRLTGYVLIHRGRFGRGSLRRSRFERRGNTFAYTGGR
jgi:hypothetical protein